MSEYPQQNANNLNQLNSFNYLPGYAAFAQGFIGAYCGIRVRDFQIDLVYPSENFGSYLGQTSASQNNVFKQPAQNVENWNVTGMLYRGNKIDILYSLKTKSVEIRNRRSNDPSITAIDDLQIIYYEGTERQEKPLKIGDSAIISLSSDTWKYAAKKSRLQRSTGYSENMHILATIHALQFNNKILRASNVANKNTNVSLILILIAIFSFKLFE